ncbi:hypothetical protein GCM10010269_60560 [Streptomyces humidus]|uniref:Uncharacterized protein n=1 Tax=Streptomyces humidus TaxID=52259 RepID=A0A918G2B8_9ACTN|nr:hypothetical protein [Streptomyces humidus]GGS13169.1 hypothetical protein GCM10010269_60560 [Streptomyces humidus]
MRLLLRANAHRQVASACWEVAASPDTPRREPWQWQVRLLTGGQGPSDLPSETSRRVAAPLPGGATVEIVADSLTAAPAVDVLDPSPSLTVVRTEGELMVLIASGGRVLVEDRHLLAEADALVLAGDDPLSVSVHRSDGSDSRVAVVRLTPVADSALSWVP